MKKSVFIIAIFSITIFVSCSKDNNIQKPEPSLNGTWQLMIVTDRATGISTYRSATTGNVQITILLDSANHGNLHGYDPCNEFFDSVSVNVADKSIQFISGNITCVYCPNLTWYEVLTGLGENTHYSFDAKERLNISCTTKIYIFQRV